VWPDAGAVDDLDALVAAEARPAPAGRPWLLVNMVTALDGAISVDGRSGGLAGPPDKAVFMALRAVADVVMAGAGTVRTERYGPPNPSESVRRARLERGQAEVPRIAIVTRSLQLDVDAPLFTEAAEPPLVITCGEADPARMADLDGPGELVVAGSDAVDLGGAMAELARRGVGIVGCEGGPHLNGDLIAADLVDEWALTLSPMLAGAGAGRASQGAATSAPRGMVLDRVLEEDSFLLTRWVRDPNRP
jgi:riboflavin biosynthesis pyrimidine reductase